MLYLHGIETSVPPDKSTDLCVNMLRDINNEESPSDVFLRMGDISFPLRQDLSPPPMLA